jgi:AraC family transcriptional regulator of adaptative response/methylated-DNA-[protein]-cysteine methyltransferase
MIAGTTADGVCVLEFASTADPRAQLRRLSLQLRCTFVRGRTSAGELLERELASYYAGELREFTVPIFLVGSAFQKSVWEALRLIPFGQTRSYGDQAVGLGKPNAVRAVGHANGQNPISVIVPCHRVIGADGRLTGYGGGLWRKRWLLRHEGAAFRDEDLQTTLAFGDAD